MEIFLIFKMFHFCNSDIQCFPTIYNGAIPAPPRGPGGLIFVQTKRDIGKASYHFESKPYVNWEGYELSQIFAEIISGVGNFFSQEFVLGMG